MAYVYNHNVQRPAEVMKTLSIRSTTASNYALETTAKGETVYHYQSNDDKLAAYDEVVKYSTSRTKQLYTSKSVIDKTRQSPLRDKAKVYTQLKQVWTAEDSDGDPANPGWDAPVDGSLNIYLPYDQVVTEADVWQFIEDLVSKWFIENRSVLPKLIRGTTRVPE